MSITANAFFVVGLKQDGKSYPWRAVAVDGADLPSSQAVLMEAYQAGAGSTRDFEIRPRAPGILSLNFNLVGPNGLPTGTGTDVVFRVRAP